MVGPQHADRPVLGAWESPATRVRQPERRMPSTVDNSLPPSRKQRTKSRSLWKVAQPSHGHVGLQGVACQLAIHFFVMHSAIARDCVQAVRTLLDHGETPNGHDIHLQGFTQPSAGSPRCDRSCEAFDRGPAVALGICYPGIAAGPRGSGTMR